MLSLHQGKLSESIFLLSIDNQLIRERNSVTGLPGRMPESGKIIIQHTSGHTISGTFTRQLFRVGFCRPSGATQLMAHDAECQRSYSLCFRYLKLRNFHNLNGQHIVSRYQLVAFNGNFQFHIRSAIGKGYHLRNSISSFRQSLEVRSIICIVLCNIFLINYKSTFQIPFIICIKTEFYFLRKCRDRTILQLFHFYIRIGKTNGRCNHSCQFQEQFILLGIDRVCFTGYLQR